MDWEGHFFDVCGLVQYDYTGISPDTKLVDANPKMGVLDRETLTKNLPKLIDFIKNKSYDEEHRNIGYQVLGIVLMRAGAPIQASVKKLIIDAANADEWASEDDSRKAVMQDFVEKVTAYNGKKPLIIKSKGLFQTIAEHIVSKKPGLVNKNKKKKTK